MIVLGVFTSIYPDGVMTLPRALLISAVGFLLVFLILGAISLFVKALGAVFSRIRSTVPAPNRAPTVPDFPEAPPADGSSTGSLTLENVSEEEAAVIMAVVSDRSGIPLERLQFHSIRLMEDQQA